MILNNLSWTKILINGNLWKCNIIVDIIYLLYILSAWCSCNFLPVFWFIVAVCMVDIITLLSDQLSLISGMYKCLQICTRHFLLIEHAFYMHVMMIRGHHYGLYAYFSTYLKCFYGVLKFKNGAYITSSAMMLWSICIIFFRVLSF